MTTSPIRRLSSTALVTLAVLAAQPVSAHFFGENSVQYEDFDFRVLRTPHFDIYSYEEEAEAGRYAARLELGRVLPFDRPLEGSFPAFSVDNGF